MSADVCGDDQRERAETEDGRFVARLRVIWGDDREYAIWDTEASWAIVARYDEPGMTAEAALARWMEERR